MIFELVNGSWTKKVDSKTIKQDSHISFAFLFIEGPNPNQ